MADVSSHKTRGRGMAFIGIAFSIGFLIGPLVGAAFAVWAKGMYEFLAIYVKLSCIY